MGVIKDRVEGSVEDLSSKWGDRLAVWGASLLAKGANELLEGAEPQTKELMRGTLTKMLENPGMTPELREALEASLEKGDWVATVMGWIGMILGSLLGLISMGAPAGRIMEYNVDRMAESFRLDPMSAITAWRRDPETYAGLFEDLKDQGWSDERIEALKFFTEFMPSAQDLVTWLAREVFEPEMRDKYGLDDESDKLDLSLFAKIGVSQEQALNYWRAHWEHPEFRTVVEMLRRTDFTEDDMRDWFRLVEIPPYWRDKLIAISWEVPTRVDVRRFWDMGTINEARLREIYTAQGYHGKDLDDYVLWTKVYVAFPDLVARYKNAWLSLDQVRTELVGLGMTAERAQELLETKFKATEEERTAAERTRTRSDIIKGVKQGKISRAQGVLLLEDMNYSAEEAAFILDVNITVDDQDEVVAMRQLTKSDIVKALKAGVMGEDEALGKLLELRYSPADAGLLLDIYRATLEPIEDEDFRELTTSYIIKGVKKGLLTQEEAYLLLQGIGYTAGDSLFILEVETVESPFSPRDYAEFKDRTGLLRGSTATGRGPDKAELWAAGGDLVIITNQVKLLRAAIKAEEGTLVYDEPPPESATVKLKELQVELNRALSELDRIQLHYNTLVARQKFSGR